MKVFPWLKLLVLLGLGLFVLPSESAAQSEKEITNSIGMKLVLIPKGTFQMGSPPSEQGSKDNESQHEVTLTKAYYLGAFEVTQAQYEKVMRDNPSHFQGKQVEERIPPQRHPKTGRLIEPENIIPVDSGRFPVDSVSWEKAVEFCNRLSDKEEEKKAGRVYRLPTEAEWEYACRAGSRNAYHFGASRKQLADFAWYLENSDSKTHPVGEKKPNAWGLYDMHGNIWEWCSDWYGEYPNLSTVDPIGPVKGTRRVYRGGGYVHDAETCRSAVRNFQAPSYQFYYEGGFRVALSLPD